AYHTRKENDAESFVSTMKLVANLVTAAVAPELLPLITPLISAMAVSYKEGKLGPHYKGENADKAGVLVDTALSVFTVFTEAAIAAREAAAIERGVVAAAATAA